MKSKAGHNRIAAGLMVIMLSFSLMWGGLFDFAFLVAHAEEETTVTESKDNAFAEATPVLETSEPAAKDEVSPESESTTEAMTSNEEQPGSEENESTQDAGNSVAAETPTSDGQENEDETADQLTNAPKLKSQNSNSLRSGSSSGTKKITVIKTWVNDDGSVRPDNLTVHIKQRNSMLKTGTEIETQLKTLSGSGSANSDNTTIQSIVQATEAQYEAKKSGLTSSNIISQSGAATFAWYENNTIYLYSEAENVYMNNISGTMFRKMRSLTDISGLSMFNTHYVTNMNRMFQDSTSITSLSALSGWEVGNVTDMTYTFGANYVPSNYRPMSINDISALSSWDVSNVQSFDQTFKCTPGITSIAAIKDWDVSNATTTNQMFNRAGFSDASELVNWDVKCVTNFNMMFANISGLSASDMPVFTNRPGTWASTGTYTPDPNPPAETSVTPPTPAMPTGSFIEYSNNGTTSGNCTVTRSSNYWSYEFEVTDDGSKWSVWEDTKDGSHLDDKNGLVDAYTESSGRRVGLGGSEANAIEGVTNDAYITNTNTKRKEITFRKTWNDNNDALGRRPSDLDIGLYLNGNKVRFNGVAYDPSQWVKSGNTWTYTFVHYSNADVTDYSLKEETVPNYYSCQPSQTIHVTRTSAVGASLQTGEASFTNNIGRGSITIGKETVGNQADKTKVFTVTIEIFEAHRNDQYKITTESGTPTGDTEIWTDSNGKGFATVYLKDTDKVKINNLEAGVRYEIKEQAAGYVNSATVSGSQIVGSSPGAYTRVKDDGSGLGTDENAIITFVNKKDGSIPTGVFTDNEPWMLQMLIAEIIGAFLLGLAIRRKQDEMWRV